MTSQRLTPCFFAFLPCAGGFHDTGLKQSMNAVKPFWRVGANVPKRFPVNEQP
jgi:hypothetical protein